VPAEARRLTRRLGARDRLFLAAFACAAVAAVVAALLLEGSNSSPGEPKGHCVTESRASIMGNANYTYCGKQADRECRHPSAPSAAFAAQCRRIGSDTG
jgi:hypothetical protein